MKIRAIRFYVDGAFVLPIWGKQGGEKSGGGKGRQAGRGLPDSAAGMEPPEHPADDGVVAVVVHR